MFDLVSELRRLRAGEADAAAAIRQHYTEKLITDRTADFGKPNAWGAMFEGIAQAVDELATNTVEPHDVDHFIQARMKWKRADHYAELDSDLSAPRGTNHYREKQGKDAAGLKRLPNYMGDGSDDERCEYDPNERDDENSNLFEDLEMTDEEEQVMDWAQAGYRASGIASRLEISETKVERIMKRLQQRARRLGYQ